MDDVNINSSVGKIREYFKSIKASSYPIKGHPLEKSEDYIKALYMEMLCVIIQYGGTPKPEQILFVQRLMEGIGISEQFNECMKKALQVDEKFAEEFVKQFKDNKLKYNFVVDSFVLMSCQETKEVNSVELLSEICEMLLLNKKNVDFLVHIALCILEQNSDIYMSISDKEFSSEIIKCFICYFKEFFKGKLVDTNSELYYFSNEKIKLDLKIKPEEKQKTVEFKQNKVTFENYIIDLSQINFSFIGCKDIKFINCSFSGVGPIKFKNCKDISIEDCNFVDFNNRVFYLESCYNLEIVRSKFEHCGKIIDNNSILCGGIICSEKLSSIIIRYCEFNNCFAKCICSFGGINGSVFCNKDNSIENASIENNNFGYFDIHGYVDANLLFYGINVEVSKYENNIIHDSNMEILTSNIHFG